MSTIGKNIISLASFAIAGGAATYYTTQSFRSGASIGLLNGTITCLLNGTLNRDSNGYKRIALTATAVGIAYLCRNTLAPKHFSPIIPFTGKDLLPPLLLSACVGSLPFLMSSSAPLPQKDLPQKPPKEKKAEKNRPLDGAAHWHKSKHFQPSRRTPVERMDCSLEKAIIEHRKKFPGAPYVKLDQLEVAKQVPLVFSHGSDAQQGRRLSMEDEHFYQETDDIILAGVFDGHRGQAAATHAKEQTTKLFLEIFEGHRDDIVTTFEVLCERLHESYRGDDGGTTALICYVDKKTQVVYTATLGDGEANIYRKINGIVLSIPLSPNRDWSTDEKFVDKGKVTKAPKDTKPRLKNVIDVSRAIGDPDYPEISQKPKVTQLPMLPGDVLVLSCDGLKDFVLEEAICKMAEQHEGSEDELARALTQASVDKQDSTDKDNVSVIVIRAQEKL